jgi:hypothetical protein
MVKNQLFRVLPEIEMINSLLKIYGLTSLQDTKSFTKNSLQENETIQKLNDMKDKLESYYLPCKSKVYINNITEKKCITILRQFIKVHGYTLISKERYIEGKKMSVYRLIKSDDKVSTPTKSKCKKDIVISFE